jgi:hypothetical protein
MAVFTIDSFSANYLTEQPLGYEGDVKEGRTARKWQFTALLTLGQTQSLLSVYDTWRTARLADPEAKDSGEVGTTVSLTCNSLVSSVSGLACWFSKAPEIKESGTYREVTVELVDAEQAVAVILREIEASAKLTSSFSIGGFTANLLKDQPYGYEGDAREGRTARRWSFDAILTLEQAQELISTYNSWRNARILDVDTKTSGVIGTTVSVTCNSQIASVSGLPCWFTKPPEFKDVGPYKQATVELVDAAQALQVILSEKEAAQKDDPDLEAEFGTYELGDAVLTLKKQSEAYQDGPEVSLLATGSHYITGTKNVTRVKDIEGTTDLAGWDAVRAWYEEIVTTTPEEDSWFPISPPSATAEAKVIDGEKTTIYTVSIALVKIR